MIAVCLQYDDVSLIKVSAADLTLLAPVAFQLVIACKFAASLFDCGIST